MTPEETGRLLAICASYDKRKIGDTDVYAWYRVLGDLPYADCENAVFAHYRDSREWIMPADVRTRVRAMRRDRLEREILPAPPAELTDDPVRYRASLAAGVADIANARSVRRAIAPAGPGGVPQSFTEARKKLGEALPKPTPQETAAQQAAESREARNAGESGA